MTDELFGHEAPSRTSVYRWYGEFNRGRRSLQDEFREGRPQSVVVPQTIDAVIIPLSYSLSLNVLKNSKKRCSRHFDSFLQIKGAE